MKEKVIYDTRSGGEVRFTDFAKTKVDSLTVYVWLDERMRLDAYAYFAKKGEWFIVKKDGIRRAFFEEEILDDDLIPTGKNSYRYICDGDLVTKHHGPAIPACVLRDATPVLRRIPVVKVNTSDVPFIGSTFFCWYPKKRQVYRHIGNGLLRPESLESVLAVDSESIGKGEPAYPLVPDDFEKVLMLSGYESKGPFKINIGTRVVHSFYPHLRIGFRWFDCVIDTERALLLVTHEDRHFVLRTTDPKSTWHLLANGFFKADKCATIFKVVKRHDGENEKYVLVKGLIYFGDQVTRKKAQQMVALYARALDIDLRRTKYGYANEDIEIRPSEDRILIPLK